MNFDNTYITLFGAVIFEPVTILTNTFTTFFCIYTFIKFNKYKNYLAKYWAWFFLVLGISASCGSVAHGVQYQLGEFFLRTFVFLVNALSLVSIYFCFKAASSYFSSNESGKNKYVNYLVIAWILILLVITIILNSFLLIKIHAGIVLLYSFIIHLITFFRKQKGSGYISLGIFISFLSILTHTIRFSVSEWFNYKDISHVIMIISLILIHKGVEIKIADISHNVKIRETQ